MNFLNLNEIIWNESFWLPNNYTWNDINKYNKFSFKYTFLYPVYLSVIIYILRCLFERFIALPIGRMLKIKENNFSKIYQHNPLLEVYFKEKIKTYLNLFTWYYYKHLSRETDLKVENIKEWFEWRKSLNKPTKMKKFTESFWRFAFYLFIWIYGLLILYKKPWFWKTSECWVNYPKHEITDDVYWYYIIELGFYLSLLVSQFFDIKRKDFWQMFLHHIVTISLLMFSYFCNFIRLGSLVLLIHDCADPWLEFSKMTSYSNLEKICNTAFIIFTFIWFITRLVTFPLKILYSTTIEAPQLMGLFPAYYLFNILLYILQVMHVIWFYMILRIAYKAFVNGNVGRDDRSESESENNENTNETNKNK